MTDRLMTWADAIAQIEKDLNHDLAGQITHLMRVYDIDPAEPLEGHPMLPWVQLGLEVRQKIAASWEDIR